jgi:hypothetical protein
MTADTPGDGQFPLPEHVEIDMEANERDLAMMHWLREWRWSQQFAPPGPLLVVTGI